MGILNICTPGHADPIDSFGLLACELASHLTALGCYVNLMALGNPRHPNQSPELAAITRQPIKAAPGAIFLGYPTSYSAHNSLTQIGRRVAICMFESSRIPATWIPILNTMDAVISPSNFCEDVFLNCGVVAPIHVIPLGIGEIFRPAPRTTDRPFTFLAFMDRGLRKGGLVALQAFLAAFGEDMNYKLILKSRKSKVTAEIAHPNVELIQEDYTEQQLYELYLWADVSVSPNRGEGFGLIPLQHAATGGIALATDWGGTGDYIRRVGVPLPYRLVKADWRGHKTLGGQDLGDWAELDPAEVAEVMRRVADNREFHSFIARVGAPAVREQYDWRRFAERVYEVWRGESKQPGLKRDIPVLDIKMAVSAERYEVR